MARKNDQTNVAIVAEVLEAGAQDKVLRGKSFSITGHLSRPRPAIVALIEKAGGRFDKTPTWGTTYLLTNADWSGDQATSRKLQKALDLGIKLLKEEDFLRMLSDH